MYMGFNLSLEEDTDIWKAAGGYDKCVTVGENHLNEQKAAYETDLKCYVSEKELDGTKIQNEWFPQVQADIFISHSHDDKTLACALAGWLHQIFGLRCFIDANVWGYADELLREMNDRLSDKRQTDVGGYKFVYCHESCKRVSQHVNVMLSIALQKMIDKVEAVIVLNTERSVPVCDNYEMNKTYSPWIYSEIVCTEIVRRKPLSSYRDKNHVMLEHVSDETKTPISYTVSLAHLNPLTVDDLSKWMDLYHENWQDYVCALDALYESVCNEEHMLRKKLDEALRLLVNDNI